MIEGKARVCDPDGVQLEITLRATVGDWRLLLGQMGTGSPYPTWKVRSVIERAIRATVATVETAHDIPDPNT